MIDENKKRMLITGVSGMLGSNLAYYFRDKYKTCGLYHTHRFDLPGVVTAQADITSPKDIAGSVDKFAPDIVIHCAALADPEACEKDPELATKVNVEGTRHVVEALEGTDIKLIAISTDAVFDGTKGDYTETDEVRPPHVYGKSKYQEELEALKRGGSLIARINIFGWDVHTRRSLGEWILNELSAGRTIKGFTDVFFSSIYTLKLAELLDAAIQKDLEGVYHFAGSTALSKYDFACKLAHAFGLNVSLIEPISVDQLNFRAQRAKKLSLNTAKLGRHLGRDIPAIDESIRAFHEDFQKKIPERIRGSKI